MAETKKDKKKKEKVEVVLERIYNVPLRSGWLRAPKYKRAKKAVNTLREFIIKHMKSEDVKIGKYANLKIWKNGIKNPPHHIKVSAKKTKDGQVTVEFVDAPKSEKVPAPLKKVRAKQSKKAAKEALAETAKKAKEAEVKAKGTKEEKAEKSKEIEKKEIDEIKKELQSGKTEPGKAKPHAPKDIAVDKKEIQHHKSPLHK